MTLQRGLTAATTRTVTEARRVRPAHAPHHTDESRLLVPGEVLLSPETGLSYHVDRFLGAGGFGQAYLAARGGDSATVPETVVVKVSVRIDGWIREAYFGQLLEGHPRAIQVFDTFPVMRGRQVLYALVLEYARHGDLSSYLGNGGKGFSEAAARREIAGILEVLRKLHRGQTLHRDLTPVNVFVCDGRRLKLGDFGIVRHQSNSRGVTAHTMNLLTAPSEIVARATPKWQARDDVYQVGQLLGMLIKGDTRTRLRAPDVRRLPCTDHLKEIVYRCIGERRKRYESADEMIDALTHPPASLKAGVLRTLKGVHLAFTGILSRTRREAALAARRAGAIVHAMPSAKTTVLVRGRPNPLQAAGRDAGLKLMEVKRLRAKGHRLTLLNETQFWRLVDGGRRRSATKRTKG